MNIRKYNEDDFQIIDSLYYTCRPDEFVNESLSVAASYLSESPEALAKFNKSMVYVYEVESEVVAFMTVNHGVIGWLYVAPYFRKKGIGGKLLLFLKAEIKEPLALYTLKSNRAAVRLYLKLGFSLVDEFVDSSLEDDVLVVKLSQ